jgi:hypothetical protein
MHECASLVVASVPTGVIVRGGPGVLTATHGSWSVAVDDMGSGRATRARLERIASDVVCDPLGAVFRHFSDRALELFAFVGPSGVVAGSAPNDVSSGVVVWADPSEGTAALGVGGADVPSDWLMLRAGTAVCWGPHGPQALCDISARSIEPWTARELSTVG